MRRWVLVCLALFITGCAELSTSKVESDGTYRFKQEPFVVWAPNECLLDMSVYDTDRSVDFTTGRGYWMASGQYAVQIFPTPDNIKDEKSFIEQTKKFVPQYMVKDRAAFGLKLAVMEEKQLTINGEPAYQAISVDPGKAVFVATFVLHKHRITAATLVYPLKGNRSARDAIPWKCYDKFVNSVHEILNVTAEP